MRSMRPLPYINDDFSSDLLVHSFRLFPKIENYLPCFQPFAHSLPKMAGVSPYVALFALFCTSAQSISIVFRSLRTLCKNTRGTPLSALPASPSPHAVTPVYNQMENLTEALS